MDINKRVIELRNHLHNIPEASEKEFKTSEFLAGELKKAGYEVQTGIAGTGVIGTIKGKEKGPVVAVKADMDALIHEVNGKECNIHSCGHDAHCAVMLTMAEVIKQSGGIKRGTLKIIFQPAEENLKGGTAVAKSGAIDDVNYLFSMHLRPIQEAKIGTATPALCHGASSMMTATVHGVPAHGARPHLGVNVIDAGAAIVNAINAIHVDPSIPWSVKVTKFVTNSKVINAVPDVAELAFDIRAQTNQLMDLLIEKVKSAITAAASINGAKVDINLLGTVPGADYDDEVIDMARKAIVDVLGDKGLLAPIITPGGDDFHFYKKEKPLIKAGFVGLGANLTPGLHSPEMKFDESAMKDGVAIMKNMVDQLLN